MKVLLNADTLAPPISGIGKYTFHMANGLERHPEVSEVRYFSRNFLTQGRYTPGATQGNGSRVETPRSVCAADLYSKPNWLNQWLSPPMVRGLLRRIPYSYELRNKASAYFLRRDKYAENNYVYHETNNILTPYQGAAVLTVTDLSHLQHPEHHPRERVKWLERYLESSIQEARQIICYSHFIRNELVTVLGVPAGKINVIYLGVSEAFHPRETAEVAQTLEKYGLSPGGYVLSVGTLEPRKNLLGLIRAFSRLPEPLRRRYPLIIAGAKGWLTKESEQAMTPLIQEQSLRWLGYAPLEDLPGLYAGARMLAYPSFYEGFGIPVLEAMASGVPVLTSNRSSMPEIAGDAGILVSPEDVGEIAHGLEQLLVENALRETCIASGLARARNFRWETTVNETVKVYRKSVAPE